MKFERNAAGLFVPVAKPPDEPPVDPGPGYELTAADRRRREPPPALKTMPPECECGAAWIMLDEDTCYTCVGFNGHDDNCATKRIECANGHRRRISIRRACDPADYDDIDHRGEVHTPCDWKGITWCSCHDYLKLDAWPNVTLRPSEYDE
jgi:hypothetical protein